MKLCFIANPNSTHTKRWLNWFLQRGHKVCLIADVSAEREWSGIQVYNLPARINITVIKYAFWEVWTRHIIQSWQPDILHAHRVSSAGWLGAFSGYHPFVVTPWGSDLYTHPKRSLAARILASRVLKHADLVTADSQDLCKTAIEYGAKPETTYVIQWGVDFKFFNPDGDTTDLRKQLSLENAPVVLSPRGLNPIYNIDTIVSAIPKVHKVIPETIFIIREYNTDPGYKIQIQALIDELDISHVVRWIGQIEPWEKIADYYRLADVAVSIASSDGTPVSVLEAMACGVPIIASRLPSLLEWIDEEKNGLIVQVRDVDSLAEAIIRLLQDAPLRKLFSSRGFRLVHERADHQSEMTKMENLYAQLVESKE